MYIKDVAEQGRRGVLDRSPSFSPNEPSLRRGLHQRPGSGRVAGEGGTPSSPRYLCDSLLLFSNKML